MERHAVETPARPTRELPEPLGRLVGSRGVRRPVASDLRSPRPRPMGHEHPHTHTLSQGADASALDGALDELRELTSELQASRTRIVEAGDAARRRIDATFTTVAAALRHGLDAPWDPCPRGCTRWKR